MVQQSPWESNTFMCLDVIRSVWVQFSHQGLLLWRSLTEDSRDAKLSKSWKIWTWNLGKGRKGRTWATQQQHQSAQRREDVCPPGNLTKKKKKNPLQNWDWAHTRTLQISWSLWKLPLMCGSAVHRKLLLCTHLANVTWICGTQSSSLIGFYLAAKALIWSRAGRSESHEVGLFRMQSAARTVLRHLSSTAGSCVLVHLTLVEAACV